MAFIKNLPAGIAIGVAAGYLAKDAIPQIGAVVRPLTKVTMKTALVGYEKVREAFAHMGESIEDLASEVRAEIHETPIAPATTEAATPPETAPGRQAG